VCASVCVGVCACVHVGVQVCVCMYRCVCTCICKCVSVAVHTSITDRDSRNISSSSTVLINLHVLIEKSESLTDIKEKSEFRDSPADMCERLNLVLWRESLSSRDPGRQSAMCDREGSKLLSYRSSIVLYVMTHCSKAREWSGQCIIYSRKTLTRPEVQAVQPRPSHRISPAILLTCAAFLSQVKVKVKTIN
jgi:hypothetical protein